MNKILVFLLSGTAVACSPIPELAAIIPAQAADGGNGADSGIGFPHKPPSDMGPTDDMRRRGGGDLGANDDMGMPSDMGPCPATPGATAAFCYWPEGPGSLNLATALVLSVADANCDLKMGRFSVTMAGTTCAAEFAMGLPASWGFSPAKPAHITISYSTKFNTDHSILTANMPAGSMNEVLKVSGVSGSQNVVNLYSPIGTSFVPGFTLSVGGPAKQGSLNFDWISVWQ